MERSEAGFTLIETMVAAAIGIVVIVLLVLLVGRMVYATASTDAKLQATTAADHVVERLVAEAASAWAVFVPAGDVFGNNNADGHEVDFFSEDGSHRTLQWAYNYNAQSKTLSRYSFAAGAQPQQDETLGNFDAFSATAVAAAQLGTVDPLFSTSSVPSVTYGYDAVPGASGGNGLVKISLQANGVNRSELLASSTTPTTFTVVVNYTPSPAPVATATPTPLTVVAGVTATPPPTATPPIPCCTPAPPSTAPPVTPPPTAPPTPCAACTPPPELMISFASVNDYVGSASGTLCVFSDGNAYTGCNDWSTPWYPGCNVIGTSTSGSNNGANPGGVIITGPGPSDWQPLTAAGQAAVAQFSQDVTYAWQNYYDNGSGPGPMPPSYSEEDCIFPGMTPTPSPTPSPTPYCDPSSGSC